MGPLSGATTPVQIGPGSDDNEGVLRITQSSSIAGTSPSDCLVSYLGHSLVGVLLLCREAVGVFYSPPPADWAIIYSLNAHTHRNTKNTKHWRLSFGSGTKLLLPSLSLGFRHEERERHNFSMLTVRPSSAFNSRTQPTHVRNPQSKNSLASPRSEKSTRFV